MCTTNWDPVLPISLIMVPKICFVKQMLTVSDGVSHVGLFWRFEVKWVGLRIIRLTCGIFTHSRL